MSGYGEARSRASAELKAAIEDYIAARNENPEPFVWKATADAILGKVANLCRKLR